MSHVHIISQKRTKRNREPEMITYHNTLPESCLHTYVVSQIYVGIVKDEASPRGIVWLVFCACVGSLHILFHIQPCSAHTVPVSLCPEALPAFPRYVVVVISALPVPRLFQHLAVVVEVGRCAVVSKNTTHPTPSSSTLTAHFKIDRRDIDHTRLDNKSNQSASPCSR